MKTINIYLKIVAFLIPSMIMLQGCTVYKSTTVTLDEAYKSQTKTKVFTSNNETLKFKRIDFINGEYYGISKNPSKFENMFLDKTNINSIKVKNKTASTILNVGVPTIVVGVIIWASVKADEYSNIEFWGN